MKRGAFAPVLLLGLALVALQACDGGGDGGGGSSIGEPTTTAGVGAFLVDYPASWKHKGWTGPGEQYGLANFIYGDLGQETSANLRHGDWQSSARQVQFCDDSARITKKSVRDLVEVTCDSPTGQFGQLRIVMIACGPPKCATETTILLEFDAVPELFKKHESTFNAIVASVRPK